jgi:hypothetical protein
MLVRGGAVSMLTLHLGDVEPEASCLLPIVKLEFTAGAASLASAWPGDARERASPLLGAHP